MNDFPPLNENVHRDLIENDELTSREPGGMIEVAKARSMQAVQGAIVMAKKFPRDQLKAERRILDACKRKGLAETSQYSFSRGGQTVDGPSIRLAEVLAQNWGNLEYGITEIDRAGGVSTMEAFCWDLETNVRKTQQFQVSHVRDTKKGRKQLTDERDVYEMTANQGSRRVRGCILAIIPGDVVDAAVAQCEATLKAAAGSKPLKDRIAEMVKMFEGFGVSQELIEKRISHPLTVDRVTETEMAQLRKIYVAIQDKVASAGDYFAIPKPEEPATNSLKERAAAAAAGNILPPANVVLGSVPPGTTLTSETSFPIPDGAKGLFDTQPTPSLKGPSS